MVITDTVIERVFAQLKQSFGGTRNEYFGLLYLEREFGIERNRALSQLAFGGNDYGVDGFHFDREKRNLYLYQFRWSESYLPFNESIRRLIDSGMERVFGEHPEGEHPDRFFQQLKSCLIENEAIIDRVFIHFVFAGDPAEAEQSQVLSKLREDLENKKYLVDRRFRGRANTLAIEFRSARTHKVGSVSHVRDTYAYSISLEDTVEREGPNGEKMTIGFIRASDLITMYQEMGQRFLDRNIRSALPRDKAVNRSIRQAIKDIVLDKDDPRAFAFNHNGVTISAQALEPWERMHRITDPGS